MTRTAGAPKSTVPNFDRIARPYRWIEYLTFGRSLERCRNHFLPRLSQCNRALVLGDGDGRFLARLLAANPTLQADAVDSSPVMLQLLKQRAYLAPADERLRTHHANALDFAQQLDHQPTYDLIATHFFLDCLTQSELDRLCNHLAPQMQSHALWLVSDFAIPTGLLHWPARIIVRSLYLAFLVLTGLRVTRLPDHRTALTSAGLTLITQKSSLLGLLTSELWQRNAL